MADVYYTQDDTLNELDGDTIRDKSKWTKFTGTEDLTKMHITGLKFVYEGVGYSEANDDGSIGYDIPSIDLEGIWLYDHSMMNQSDLHIHSVAYSLSDVDVDNWRYRSSYDAIGYRVEHSQASFYTSIKMYDSFENAKNSEIYVENVSDDAGRLIQLDIGQSVWASGEVKLSDKLLYTKSGTKFGDQINTVPYIELTIANTEYTERLTTENALILAMT